jgi:hypothetical protein
MQKASTLAGVNNTRSGPKKSASRVLIAPGWRGQFSGVMMSLPDRFGVSSTDDSIGGAEDFLGALFGDRFRVKTVPSAEPILNVTSAKLRSLKPQRFTTKKCDGFRFNLAQTTRCCLIIGEICLGGMAQYYVSLC